MELFIAAWSIRLAAVAALTVGGLSVSVGTPPLDAVLRAVAAALVFTIGGRVVIGRLETSEHRLERVRARIAAGGDRS